MTAASVASASASASGIPTTPNSFAAYPKYSSAVSTPRMRPQNSVRGSLEAVQLAAEVGSGGGGSGHVINEYSVASDGLGGHSEATVIEQQHGHNQRRHSNARSVNSIQSGRGEYFYLYPASVQEKILCFVCFRPSGKHFWGFKYKKSIKCP